MKRCKEIAKLPAEAQSLAHFRSASMPVRAHKRSLDFYLVQYCVVGMPDYLGFVVLFCTVSFMLCTSKSK